MAVTVTSFAHDDGHRTESCVRYVSDSDVVGTILKLRVARPSVRLRLGGRSWLVVQCIDVPQHAGGWAQSHAGVV